MKKKYTVDELFDSLNGIEPAKAPDFFTARLWYKLKADEKTTVYTRSVLLLKPLPVLVLCMCLLIVNVYTISYLFSAAPVTEKEQDGIVSFATEYNLYNTTDFTDKN